MAHPVCLLVLVAVALGAARSARAQGEPVRAEAVVAPLLEGCFPSCRTGFVCEGGSCSECEPPCSAGEQCHGTECDPPAPPATPPSSWSDQRPASLNSGQQRHDGFMLRLALGMGYANTPAEATGDYDDITIHGSCGTFSFDIGGAIAENLALHARFSDSVQVDPRVSIEGNDSELDWSFAGFLIAPALTYYFVPLNVYVTAALGLSWLITIRDRSSSDLNSVTGFGANLDLGKEWWVSDNWGLGVSARFWWTHAVDATDLIDVTYNLLGTSVQFSATYD